MSSPFASEDLAQDIPGEFLVDESDEENVSYLAQLYRDAYDEAEVAAKKADRLKRVKKYLSEKLYDALVAANLDKITTTDGSFGQDLKEKISVKPGMNEGVFAYLEEIGQGDCIKRSVHFQTLNKLYREGVLVERDPELFATWQEKAIRIRRS